MEDSVHDKVVARMTDYIESHLDQHITLRDLANAGQYSPWHCARLFKESMGIAPFAYIRRLRLTEAARQISNSDRRIVDVAFDFIFDSHEGFTRAFSREFGLSPSRFREEGRPSPVFLPPQLRMRWRSMQRGESKVKQKAAMQTVFVQIIERPKRKLIVKFARRATHYFEYCEELGCDIWDTLATVKEALYEPVGLWFPQAMHKANTGEYAQGVEVSFDYHGEIPQGFEIIELPPGSFMVFQGPPFKEEDYESAIMNVWDIMKAYDPSLYGYEWADEENPRFQLAPMGYRGYIEARPVKQLSGVKPAV